MSTTLGTTIACLTDVGPRFDAARTDYEIARDEAFHRLTTDSVLGDADEAADWGEDVRGWIGAKLTDGDLAVAGPRLAAVLQRSARFESADVKVTRDAAPSPGLTALLISVTVTTSKVTTFAFLFRLTPDTFAQVGVTAGST